MLMPDVRQGPAPDDHRTGGSQPAHQSMSTDVQQARLLPCTTSSAAGATADTRQRQKMRPYSLKADIRAHGHVRSLSSYHDRADGRGRLLGEAWPSESNHRASSSTEPRQPLCAVRSSRAPTLPPRPGRACLSCTYASCDPPPIMLSCQRCPGFLPPRYLLHDELANRTASASRYSRSTFLTLRAPPQPLPQHSVFSSCFQKPGWS